MPKRLKKPREKRSRSSKYSLETRQEGEDGVYKRWSMMRDERISPHHPFETRLEGQDAVWAGRKEKYLRIPFNLWTENCFSHIDNFSLVYPNNRIGEEFDETAGGGIMMWIVFVDKLMKVAKTKDSTPSSLPRLRASIAQRYPSPHRVKRHNFQQTLEESLS